MNILIIDADLHAAAVTGEILSRAIPGSEIIIIAHPRDAAPLLERQAHGLVVIDPAGSLPQSLALIESIQQQANHPLVAILASNPNTALRRAIHARNVSIYLEKPITLPHLSEAIKQLFRRKVLVSASG